MRNPDESSVPIVHDLSESLYRNTTSGEVDSVEVIMDTDNNWLVHEFDNITLIDNAPYVGLRKVDSLSQYLLVCRCDTVSVILLPLFSAFCPVWGRGTTLPPLSIFPPFTFPFLLLALPIFFFCPSLPFLPE